MGVLACLLSSSCDDDNDNNEIWHQRDSKKFFIFPIFEGPSTAATPLVNNSSILTFGIILFKGVHTRDAGREGSGLIPLPCIINTATVFNSKSFDSIQATLGKGKIEFQQFKLKKEEINVLAQTFA